MSLVKKEVSTQYIYYGESTTKRERNNNNNTWEIDQEEIKQYAKRKRRQKTPQFFKLLWYAYTFLLKAFKN